MDFTNADITKSGKRIKEERKRRKITQERLAETINYASRNELSACENGKRFLKEESYIKLSNEWDLRIEYILGIDDFRTYEDYENFIMNIGMGEFNSTMAYLKTLGLQFTPKYYMETNVIELSKIEKSPEKYNAIRSCYSEKAKSYIDKRIKTPLAYNITDRLNETIELTGIPDNNMLASPDKTQKINKQDFIDNDLFGDYRTYIDEIFPDYNDIRANISLLFEITYKEEIIGIKEAYDIQSFLSHIDNICEICIRDLLRY